MVSQNLDKSEVIYTIELLPRGLVLHELSHPLYVPADEKWKVHHEYPGKVHE